MNFLRIKKNYDTQLWNKDMVRHAYEAGIITEEQFYFIVGKEVENGNTNA